ncbi:MAG: hypothetical protein WAV38_06300, partial [Xanthobacteraceae bacterium]
ANRLTRYYRADGRSRLMSQSGAPRDRKKTLFAAAHGFQIADIPINGRMSTFGRIADINGRQSDVCF